MLLRSLNHIPLTRRQEQASLAGVALKIDISSMEMLQ